MRTNRVIILYCLASLLIPAYTCAQPGTSAQSGASAAYQPESRIELKGLVPSALEAYATSEALTAQTAREVSAELSADGLEVLMRPAFLGMAGDDASESNGGVSYLPVLFSALMPGTGELYLGYNWRGAALISLEIAAWAGYFYYRNEGLDSREAYEGFADEHWNIQKWVDHHPEIYDLTGFTIEDLEEIGREKSGSQDWPGYLPYVSKEEDKQHYYENIGKYDWYISGWRDFDPEQDDPWMRDTPLRTTYRDMRKESNDQLDTANQFIYLSLGVRVFSIIETLFLARSSGSSDEAEDVSRNRLRLETRPLGIRGAEIALEYRFK